MTEFEQDVRALLIKLHELWDRDDEVHVGKLLIACLDQKIHYNPLASRIAAMICCGGIPRTRSTQLRLAQSTPAYEIICHSEKK